MTGIGLMMATALENNGATVYIVGRRGDVLEKAAAENNVCYSHSFLANDVPKIT
jgi:NADP-dependent 3-hydroxy acid dehydrogenase YdfG